ncbi:hypothetical protein CFE70_002355 [Pyrenophora teres f. teres 0-1]
MPGRSSVQRAYDDVPRLDGSMTQVGQGRGRVSCLCCDVPARPTPNPQPRRKGAATQPKQSCAGGKFLDALGHYERKNWHQSPISLHFCYAIASGTLAAVMTVEPIAVGKPVRTSSRTPHAARRTPSAIGWLSLIDLRPNGLLQNLSASDTVAFRMGLSLLGLSRPQYQLCTHEMTLLFAPVLLRLSLTRYSITVSIAHFIVLSAPEPPLASPQTQRINPSPREEFVGGTSMFPLLARRQDV